jgi:hypothetical protein
MLNLYKFNPLENAPFRAEVRASECKKLLKTIFYFPDHKKVEPL